MAIIGVKGTLDIYSKKAENYSYVENVSKEIASLFAFNEIRLPVIEHSELFVRGVGEGSDVVRKEMYTFDDKGGRSITLRPEFTAGIIRSFVQNKLYATMDYPAKFAYCGPVFRYERPQLGRYRQFNQFGVESLGSNSPYADIEVIVLAYTILTSLGLEGVTLKINSLGDEESRNNYKTALKEFFAKHIDNMCDDCKSRYELNPLRILDCKDPNDQIIIKDAPKISDYLTEASKERFAIITNELTNLDIPFEIDEGLVRGLDYYSDVVFEFHYVSAKGNNYGAIGAGGHYAHLVKEVGGPDLAGVGFSFGVDRVVNVLEDDGIIPTEDDESIFAFVIPMDNSLIGHAQELAFALRVAGYKSECIVETSKLGSMIKKANKKNSKYAIIIGQDEKEQGVVQIKDLNKQTQETIAHDEVISYFDKKCRNDCECSCHDDECCCGGHEEHECCCGHHGHEHSCECGCHDGEHYCGHKPGDFPCVKTGKCPCGNDFNKCNCHKTGHCACLEGGKCECGCQEKR